ncbi:MAG: nucleotidyltransferase domain-containing protein [Ruminococcus sp.]|nr:nucleotidyltransferase domain-containing protein [Ruminococcus sp.]
MHGIIELCKRYGVRSLAVFGSILTDRFKDTSDVDFLVDFVPQDPDTFDYVINYLDFKEALEKLLGRTVDLVVGKTLRNKYFIESVNSTKMLIYG